MLATKSRSLSTDFAFSNVAITSAFSASSARHENLPYLSTGDVRARHSAAGAIGSRTARSAKQVAAQNAPLDNLRALEVFPELRVLGDTAQKHRTTRDNVAQQQLIGINTVYNIDVACLRAGRV